MLFRESVTSTTALKDPGTGLVTTSDRMALSTGLYKRQAALAEDAILCGCHRRL